MYEKALQGGRGSLEPWIKDSIIYYPHQLEGVRTLARMRSFILADDMGLGKTLQAMTVFGLDVYMGYSKTAVVVCPVSLIGNWKDELEAFTGFPFVALDGSPKKRAEQLEEFKAIEGPKVLILNYEKVAGHLDDLNGLAFDVAIFDEAHLIKNYKSARTKAALALYSKRSFLLTGTPLLNQVNELWPLLHRIEPDKYPRYWNFVNRYCVFGGFKDKQIIGVKNKSELTGKLQGVMLRRMKDEVLDLPPVQIIERRVDMLPAQRKLYDEVINEMRLPRPDTDDPEDIENALTKFLRLKQICGTTLPFTGTDVSGKLDLCIEDDMEIIENGHKIVIFTQFLDVQAAYTRRIKEATKGAVPVFELNGATKDRQGVVAAWKAVKGASVIVCMLQVAGVGLNMTASRHGAFLDELFVPGLNQQAIDRLNRIGASETQSIQIRKYIMRNSIESRIQGILRTKKTLFGEIVETDPDWKRKILATMIEEGVA